MITFFLIISLVFVMAEIVSKFFQSFFHLVSKSLDDRKCNLVDGVFLDFSSAFSLDKVDHNILLKKLHSLWLRGPFLQWIGVR